MFVVLWGAAVRATGSGAGCGSHWPLCNGDVVPRSAALETIIEFTHRITSGIALISVAVLCVWAWRRFAPRSPVRRFAVLSLVFILVEAALGAGLVLLDYVEKNESIGRAFYLSAHLTNTQVLLAMIALTAWFSRRGAPASPVRVMNRPAVAATLPVLIFVGISGAVAALGDTLYPASSLAEGFQQDLSPTASILLRLRMFHPLVALLAGAYVSSVVLKVLKAKISPLATRLSWWSWGIVGVQLIAGAVNILLLAPVWMQLLHLFLANALWLAVVFLVVESSQMTGGANR
jgi:cytochrome c oxidase assembly protein subunit 15